MKVFFAKISVILQVNDIGLNSSVYTKGLIVTYSEKGKVILQLSEKVLLNRLEEIMVEVNNDRARANEEKN